MTEQEKKDKNSVDCNVCAHEEDNSGYCLDCYFGNKWRGKEKEDER